MKYVEQVLQPGEKIVYATSLHWLVYLRFIVLLILAGALSSYRRPSASALAATRPTPPCSNSDWTCAPHWRAPSPR